MSRALRSAIPLALAAMLLAGCSTAGHPGHAQRSAGSPSGSTASALPRPAPPPKAGSCHALTFAQAAAPTDTRQSVPCRSAHTSVTTYVGTFDPVVDGHLMAVDSKAVQDQLAARCPARLASYVGGTLSDRRLSRLQTVWFGPTIHQAELGARWFRCDVVALGKDGELASLGRSMRGILDRAAALSRYGTCGTAAPSTPHFARVICSEPHTWKAAAVIALPAHAHFLAKGPTAVASASCKNVAASRAGDALKYTWSFEWPTKQQWQAGQRYGLCWLPSS